MLLYNLSLMNMNTFRRHVYLHSPNTLYVCNMYGTFTSRACSQSEMRFGQDCVKFLRYTPHRGRLFLIKIHTV